MKSSGLFLQTKDQRNGLEANPPANIIVVPNRIVNIVIK